MIDSMILQTKYSSKSRLIFFPSSHQKNKLITCLLAGDRDEEDLEVKYADERFCTKYGYIRSVVHPEKSLKGEAPSVQDQPFIHLELVFEDGFRCKIPIIGKVRASNMFRRAKEVQHKKPDGNKTNFLSFFQDNKRSAIIRWDTLITEIFCTEGDSQ